MRGLLLGLIGVEGAVIAPAATHITFRVIAISLLLVPSALLLIVLRSSRIRHPSHPQLVDAVLGGRHPTWLVVEQNLKVLEPELSLAAQFKKEACLGDGSLTMTTSQPDAQTLARIVDALNAGMANLLTGAEIAKTTPIKVE